MSKLIRDKKTNAIINTDTDELTRILSVRQREKQIIILNKSIEQLQQDFNDLRQEFKSLESKVCHVA